MKMRTFNPQLAELMSELEKSPLNTTLRTFADIVAYMRNTHALLMINREKFERIYSDAVRSGKFTVAGLQDQKEDFEDAYKSLSKKFADIISSEIDKWKSQEQKNAYAVVSKAPTDEQARSLEVILKRDTISQAELEMWAKNFSDNYICSCAFRDYAKRMGYIVLYSDFTDAEERIEVIEDAYAKLQDMLKNISIPENGKYNLLLFYGTNESGNYYSGTWAENYTSILDADSTFKPQKIEVKPITEEQAS